MQNQWGVVVFPTTHDRYSYGVRHFSIEMFLQAANRMLCHSSFKLGSSLDDAQAVYLLKTDHCDYVI